MMADPEPFRPRLVQLPSPETEIPTQLEEIAAALREEGVRAVRMALVLVIDDGDYDRIEVTVGGHVRSHEEAAGLLQRAMTRVILQDMVD